MWPPETFSSTLTSEKQNSGMGGIAMLTLSDTENNLHFILILQGLIKRKEKGETGRRGQTEPPKGAADEKQLESWVGISAPAWLLNRSLSAEPHVVPIRVQLVYRQHILREIQANITSHVSNDPQSR